MSDLDERRADQDRATVERVERLAAEWEDLLATESEIMTTAQRNAWKDALLELRAVLRGDYNPAQR